jgi:redox-sensitive bicupin YhaK (pirin superfamily)
MVSNISAPAVAQVIEPRARDIGGFAVRRILPHMRRRTVGPFIFLDHMGPADLPPGEGLDVAPHPHIGLATVTYLFEGEILHRDSLGSEQPIRPGDVNWMTAGAGIVHSERTPEALRRRGSRVQGIQSWVALPLALEETAPAFTHHPKESLPAMQTGGVALRLVAGSAYGERAPVETASPIFYVAAEAPEGGALTLPEAYPERAVYVVEGRAVIEEAIYEPGQMAVIAADAAPRVDLAPGTRLMLLGGEPLEGRRHIWWNFVSSSKERIERAKDDWRSGRFPMVPGDNGYTPLPEG